MRTTSVEKVMTSGSPSSPLGRWSGMMMQVPSIQRTKALPLSATFLMSAVSSLVASLMGGATTTSWFCKDVFSCRQEQHGKHTGEGCTAAN
jgi:hypothetical protein